MGLQIERQTLETERLVGEKTAQALVRAEALVPGAGRDAIEPLLADANLYIAKADLQTDRVVIEGVVSCQAVYRQGEETTLRALTATTALNHVSDIPDAEPDMLCRVRAEVDHVDARYENGHIVFQIACTVRVQVTALSPAEVIRAISGEDGLETRYTKLESVKLAAESSEMALLRDSVSLPAALDARMALMDWMTVEIDEAAPDLGGVRVKGRAMVETLVSSGAPGRPAVVVRYPLALDQLVELPDWLAPGAFAEAEVRSVQSRVEPAEDEEGETKLVCEAELRVRVYASVTDTAEALTDIYAIQGNALSVERTRLSLCSASNRAKVTESVRGTLLIGENAAGVGTVIATLAHPAVGEWRVENGQTKIEGVLEAAVLYLPGGTDRPASTESEMPFSLTVPLALEEGAIVDIQVISAEVSALMSDRLEMKAQLGVTCESPKREEIDVVREVAEGGPVQRRPGIIITWPGCDDDAWSVGKRYGVPAAQVGETGAGKPIVLKV